MIEKLESKDFDKVFQLMEMSFPEDEYRTYDEQKKLLQIMTSGSTVTEENPYMEYCALLREVYHSPFTVE